MEIRNNSLIVTNIMYIVNIIKDSKLFLIHSFIHVVRSINLISVLHYNIMYDSIWILTVTVE